MNFNHPNRSGSTIVARTMCAIVFLCFSLFWLYFFQSDALSITQHVLSGGQTHYNRIIGTVLITAILWLLQIGVSWAIGLKKRYHALSYLPSMLGLAVISNISSNIDSHSPFGSWWWIVPLVIFVWLLVVFFCRNLQTYDNDTVGHLFSRRVWVNMLLMVLMIIGVVSLANTNAVFHFRAHAETALLRGDINEALNVGHESLESDASLLMLRAYALSRQGRLGERLFHYPITGTSADLLPLGGHSQSVVYPADSIYRYLGAIPKGKMTTVEYLQLLEKTGKATPAVADYRLCAMLIDRDIDSFACNLPRYYTVNDSLPRHYREALVLYKRLRSTPVVEYHDAVVDVDYNDLKKLESEYPDATERKVRVAEKYYGSYWYYYLYAD